MPPTVLRCVLPLVLLATVPRVAPAQDAGTAGDLGQLLALEDRREFDAAVLQRAAQHPDSLVRLRAAVAMGHIRDRAALAILVPMLADRDSLVRPEVAFALGEIGDRTAVAELAALAGRLPTVAQGDFTVEIVAALAKLGGPDAERALAAILDRHPAGYDYADRATAAVLGEAWRLGRRSSLAARLAGYIRDGRGDWRLNAVYSAGRLRLAPAAPALMVAASDSDASIRAYAARSLVATLADSAAVPREAMLTVLRPLVNDPDAQVRTNALRALASFADSSLVPLVAGRLSDRDPNVAVQAANTLDTLKGSRAATLLAERFPGAANWALRRAMLLALAHAAPAQAMETGRGWRTDPDWRTRAAYAEMLAVAASPAARQQLYDMAGDPEPRVQGFVLTALGSLVPPGDSALLALARSRLTSADYVVRANAIDLVARERDPATVRELVDAYRRAASDADNDARVAAVRGLADIAQLSAAARSSVEVNFLASQPRSPDYLVRRFVAQRFGDATLRRYWNSVLPVETGRSTEEYRDIARRYLLGTARPGPVTIETDRGSITLQLFAAEAPLTVENFLRLADRRYFDGGRWHRVVPNFVVQDGDPRGDGSGGPGTVIRDEINRHRYGRGTLGMALSGPDTGGSQFFITHSPQPHLDGGYTVFGQVVGGWDVLDQIVQGDRIRRITR